MILFVATSSGGEYVRDYLLETLRTMDMLASEEQTLTVLTARNSISAAGDIQDPTLRATIAAFLTKLLG